MFELLPKQFELLPNRTGHMPELVIYAMDKQLAVQLTDSLLAEAYWPMRRRYFQLIAGPERTAPLHYIHDEVFNATLRVFEDV